MCPGEFFQRRINDESFDFLYSIVMRNANFIFGIAYQIPIFMGLTRTPMTRDHATREIHSLVLQGSNAGMFKMKQP